MSMRMPGEKGLSGRCRAIPRILCGPYCSPIRLNVACPCGSSRMTRTGEPAARPARLPRGAVAAALAAWLATGAIVSGGDPGRSRDPHHDRIRTLTARGAPGRQRHRRADRRRRGRHQRRAPRGRRSPGRHLPCRLGSAAARRPTPGEGRGSRARGHAREEPADRRARRRRQARRAGDSRPVGVVAHPGRRPAVARRRARAGDRRQRQARHDLRHLRRSPSRSASRPGTGGPTCRSATAAALFVARRPLTCAASRR